MELLQFSFTDIFIGKIFYLMNQVHKVDMADSSKEREPTENLELRLWAQSQAIPPIFTPDCKNNQQGTLSHWGNGNSNLQR